MRRIVAVVPDLFFATRITATANAVGVALVPAALTNAVEAAAAQPTDLVIVDLHAPGDPLAMIRALKTDPRTRATPILGFFSHVAVALRAAALAAGAEQVLPRSAFTARLPDLLAGTVARPDGGSMHPLILEDEASIGDLVRAMRVVAVVGAKDGRDPDAPAYSIPAMLQQRGRRVIPINPTIATALGVPALPGVLALAERVDVLDVFRRIDALPALADEILALPEERRPVVVWFQSGIRHDPTAIRLAEAGVRVVQDRCLGVYANRYPAPDSRPN